MKFLFSLILLLISGISLADFISDRAEEIKITVYRDDNHEYYEIDETGAADTGLAMITETRSIELVPGHNRVIFHGVADGIIPQTAKLEEIKGTIIESNFDYDLMTPDELIAKSTDKTVKIFRTNSSTGEVIENAATIRSSENGVVLEVDGKFVALSCSGEIEKIVFPSAPPELVKEPTLSVIVNAETKGVYQVRLSYLAVGIQWKANYVATVNAKNKTMDLMAWVTLLNARSTNFANVPVQVIAGRVERNLSETVPPSLRRFKIITKCWPDLYWGKVQVNAMYSDESVEEIIVTGIRASIVKTEEFADYKLYSFPQKTTISAYQSKQVMLLSKNNIPFKSRYRHDFSIDDIVSKYNRRNDNREDNKFPVLQIYTSNTLKNNLGISLPEGEVAIQEHHSNRVVLIGEDSIRDTPAGLIFSLELEETPEIIVKTRVLEYQNKKDITQLLLEFEIDNRKSKKINFHLQQLIPEQYRILEIMSESLKHEVEYGKLVWASRINARATKKIKIKLKLKEVE